MSISSIRTGGRKICTTRSKYKVSEPEAGTDAKNECDSNADTCCLGSNFIIFKMTNRTADVYPYDESYMPLLNVPIVSGATAYDDPKTGQTSIIVFNESLYYGKNLGHSLINPNQIRHFGIDLWDNAYDRNHDLSIEVDDTLNVEMTYEGTKCQFKSRAPTQEELSTCPHYDMTSKRTWNPSEVQIGSINTQSNQPRSRRISNINVRKYEYIDTSTVFST